MPTVDAIASMLNPDTPFLVEQKNDDSVEEAESYAIGNHPSRAWRKEGEISAALSATAYCGKQTYLTREWISPEVKGFVATKVISDYIHDTQGFVGYLPSNNSIYVVFRGSSSIPNWITNINALQAKYKKWPKCKCQVHKGWQQATENVYFSVHREVKRLKKKFPHYKVKTTGHSLGAAMAHLTGMSLIKDGYKVEMINFGQPRLGDEKYYEFADKHFPHSRVTHFKDIVP